MMALSALMAVAALNGCTGLSSHAFISAAQVAALPNVVSTLDAQYRAYGDSITSGSTLSGTQKPYPAFVAEDEKVTYANNAMPGDQACDVPTRQIFPNQDAPTLASHPVYTLLVGTNDATVKGAGAYETVFRLCHQAAISWLAIPEEYKVLAGESEVTTTGAGTLDTSNHWNAWTTSEAGASISFPITTSAPGPVYAWPRIVDGNSGTFTYALDGVVAGSGSTGTSPRVNTNNGSSGSMGILRLPSVPAGKHVVTFVQTSEGANGLSIVGIGSGAPRSGDQFPTVLVGTIPSQRPGSRCDSSHGACQHYIDDIEADVNLLAADGLKVRLFDTRTFMFGTPLEMNDPVHPNEYGHLELGHAVESVW
jgi:lysophospholipase L1-like esterase